MIWIDIFVCLNCFCYQSDIPPLSPGGKLAPSDEEPAVTPTTSSVYNPDDLSDIPDEPPPLPPRKPRSEQVSWASRTTTAKTLIRSSKLNLPNYHRESLDQISKLNFPHYYRENLDKIK